MSELLSFESALKRLVAGAAQVATGSEAVATLAALGRVLATDVTSEVAVPPLDNSAMDGYAVRSADITSAGVRLPVSQRIAAGSVGEPLLPGTAARIFTGAPVPSGADAVVMQERCVLNADGVQLNHVPQAGDNVRRCGEDIAPGQVVLAAGTRLGPAHLGVAASVGAATLTVRKRLRVALFSTGDELVMPGESLRPGAIYNSNRYTLHALLSELGCSVSDLGIVPDELEATRAVLREAAHGHDLILTSGGVSVGEEDHVKAAVEAEGQLDLWKLAIKPGKPLAYGQVHRQVGAGNTAIVPVQAAFIGLPGNPVSSFVTFVMLVRPFILAAMGAHEAAAPPRRMTAAFEWPRAGKSEARREFLRARIGADGRLKLYPSQGSGVLTSCVWADGLVDNPPGHKIQPGDTVDFLPFSEWLR
ncbi:MAG: molybdopterin molybdotransferase MoeA [Rhodocyclaceae bacterium]|nr:molybdopterin molybdotransferase MoeA [Rhodocyclaceae bacterium]